MKDKIRDKSKKRTSITNAAVKAFQELGYDNTSMDYIAELAQASKRTVYNHFPSKEMLFKEVLNNLINELTESKQIEYSSERSLQDQLGDFADAKIAMVKDPSSLGLMKVIMGVFISHPEIAEETMDKLEAIEDTLEVWLKAASRDGELNVINAKQAADIFWSMISGALFWPVVLKGPIEKQKANNLKEELIVTFLSRYK